MIKLYNSLSGKIENFPKQEIINIYSCGPTVYDYAHIGNMRTFLFEDLLIRSLKYFNYEVNHIRNITDIDDKIIINIKKNGCCFEKFTKKYIREFLNDLEYLNFDLSTTSHIKATEYINEMIDLIKTLIEHGHAYETKDGVYFKISTYSHYGDFAILNLEHLKKGASGSNLDFSKEEVGDFVLWKKHKADDGLIFWESPWGKGRPGWHTECASILKKNFPNGVDIHTGGIDLLFPHHTNEKAHCECLNEIKMSKFWLHTTHLLVDNKKMSKSSGNFYTIRDLMKEGFDHSTIRFYLQTGAHYRTPLNFTLEGLKAVDSTLKRLNNFIHELIKHPHINGLDYNLKTKFGTFLKDDFNISGALGEIFNVINAYYIDKKAFNTEKLLDDLKHINFILNVMSFSDDTTLSPEAKQLLDLRTKARQNKEWIESDFLRDELLKLGIEVRDSKDGTHVYKVKKNI